MINLILGALGGVCPSMSKLAATYVAVPTTPLPEPGWYFGMFLFAVLGAVVAFAFGAADTKTALVAGIAAPAIISSAVTGAQQDRPVQTPRVLELPGQAPGKSGWLWHFSISAIAQESSPGLNGVTGRVPDWTTESIKPLVILPEVEGGLPLKSSSGVDINVTLKNGTKIPLGRVQTLSGPLVFQVPIETRSVTLGDTTVELKPDQSVVDLRVTTRPTVGGDLRWALGGNRQYDITDLAAQARASLPRSPGDQGGKSSWPERLPSPN